MKITFYDGKQKEKHWDTNTQDDQLHTRRKSRLTRYTLRVKLMHDDARFHTRCIAERCYQIVKLA